LLCLSLTTTLFSQDKQQQTSLLWKVSENGLSKPSFSLVTYHFLSGGFVDTLPAVREAYAASEAVVGELVIDSTIQGPMMEASLLQGTTLQRLLPDTLYTKTSKWFKEEAGWI
jgi:hypothetical protein